MFPIRGILFEIDAPWKKHFLYEDLKTFTIPVINSVYLDTVKQDNNTNTVIPDEDRNDILQRYVRLQPAMEVIENGAEGSFQSEPHRFKGSASRI